MGTELGTILQHLLNRLNLKFSTLKCKRTWQGTVSTSTKVQSMANGVHPHEQGIVYYKRKKERERERERGEGGRGGGREGGGEGEREGGREGGSKKTFTRKTWCACGQLKWDKVNFFLHWPFHYSPPCCFVCVCVYILTTHLQQLLALKTMSF